MNTIANNDVFTPSAANGSAPSRPTKAVSTSDTSGSAASVASAGSANARMVRFRPELEWDREPDRGLDPGRARVRAPGPEVAPALGPGPGSASAPDARGVVLTPAWRSLRSRRSACGVPGSGARSPADARVARRRAALRA